MKATTRSKKGTDDPKESGSQNDNADAPLLLGGLSFFLRKEIR